MIDYFGLEDMNEKQKSGGNERREEKLYFSKWKKAKRERREMER